MNETTQPCCSDFRKAMEVGTDNEGYGRLIYTDDPPWPFRMGCDLPPLDFCPWCGVDVRHYPKEEKNNG